MKIKLPLLGTIRKLNAFLDEKEKMMTFFFLFMTIIGAIAELVSLSLILPFIHIIQNPSLIQTQPKLHWIYTTIGFSTNQSFYVFSGLCLILVYFLKNLYFFLFQKAQNIFISKKKTTLMKELMAFYLEKPLSFHFHKNSTELSRNIGTAARVMDSVWLPMIQFFSELMVMMAAFVLLLWIQPLATFFAIFLIGGMSLFFYQMVKSKVNKWATAQFHHSKEISKWIHQGFGGIKEVKVLNKESFFLNSFSKHSEESNQLTCKSQTISQIPRLLTETLLASSVVFFIIVSVLVEKNPEKIIPTLALVAVAALRLMPSINRLLATSLVIKEGGTVIDLVYHNLSDLKSRQAKGNTVKKPISDFPFAQKIEIKDLSHKYDGSNKFALNSVSLHIHRGESVAFVGHSGAGKTTIVDVLLGLLTPTSGQVFIDGNDLFSNVSGWQSKIGYIPQNIFLTDDTIRRNVAFGVEDEKINDMQVWTALKIAQLDGFVQNLPKKLDSAVGERGVLISGGQRQRIGIARALYHNPQVLVLDEATSSLDNETERAISASLEMLRGKMTIVIIAHRLSTVSRCDKLFFMKEGQLIATGSYVDLMRANPEFERFAQT